MHRRFHAVITLTLLVAGVAQGADSKWVRLRSANFELLTSAGERAGRRTIRQFERIRATFRQAMQWEVSNPVPVQIVLFKSKRDYLPYRPNEGAAAYFQSGPEVDRIVMVAGSEETVAIHEYVHLLVRRSGLRLPLWINEGLADLYSTMRQVGGRLVVGYAHRGRIATLLREKWVPLEQVLVAGKESQHYTKRERRGKFYAESWALTHMLVFSQEYGPRVTELLQLLTADRSSVAALETAYGTPIEKLQRDLKSYVRQDRLRAVVLDLKLEENAERTSTEPLAELELGLLLADLVASLGKTEEARAIYKKVSRENPEAPGPYEGLGHLEYRQGDNNQARVYFGRAFELGGNSPRMLRRYAWLQREADDDKVVMTLLRAVRSSPEDVEMKLALGSRLIRNGSYAQATAILQVIQSASEDQARSALRMLAYARLKLNERESGRQAAQQLLELARTPDEVNDARHLLSLLERDVGGVREGQRVAQDGSQHEFGEREVRLTRDKAAAPPEGPETLSPREEMSMVAGLFVRLDCLGDQARMHLAVDGEPVSLLINDGGIVELEGSDGASVDLYCGEQAPRSVVVHFLPSENIELGTRGVVRSIEFTGSAN